MGRSNPASACTNKPLQCADRAASTFSRSISLPAVGIEARKHQYEAKLAEWKRNRASLGDEFGIRWFKPLNTTDVTTYFKDFLISSGGIPMHKINIKEPVTLLDPKLKIPVPNWK